MTEPFDAMTTRGTARTPLRAKRTSAAIRSASARRVVLAVQIPPTLIVGSSVATSSVSGSVGRREMERTDDLTFTVTCTIHPALFVPPRGDYSFRRNLYHLLTPLYPRGNDV